MKGDKKLMNFYRKTHNLRGELPLPADFMNEMRLAIGVVVGDIVRRKRKLINQLDHSTPKPPLVVGNPFVYGMESYEDEIISELEDLGIKINPDQPEAKRA